MTVRPMVAGRSGTGRQEERDFNRRQQRAQRFLEECWRTTGCPTVTGFGGSRWAERRVKCSNGAVESWVIAAKVA